MREVQSSVNKLTRILPGNYFMQNILIAWVSELFTRQGLEFILFGKNSRVETRPSARGSPLVQKAPQILVLHLKQEKTVLLSIAEHGAIIPYLPIYFMRVCVCVCVYKCVCVCVDLCVWPNYFISQVAKRLCQWRGLLSLISIFRRNTSRAFSLKKGFRRNFCFHFVEGGHQNE